MPLNKNTDNRYEILNTYVNAISMDETIRRVEEIIKRGIPTQHVVINAEIIDFSNNAQRNMYGLWNKKLRPGIIKRNLKLMPYYNLIQSEIQDYEEFKKKYFVW